ncbi:hypothetical protein BH09BAC2_BH09BAC2_19980 [soil metagenome]
MVSELIKMISINTNINEEVLVNNRQLYKIKSHQKI